jgi:hypothetical protein
MANTYDPKYVGNKWYIDKSKKLKFLYEADVGGTKIRDGGTISAISFSSAQRVGDDTAEVIKLKTSTGLWMARYNLMTVDDVKKKADLKVPAIAELNNSLPKFVSTYQALTTFQVSFTFTCLLLRFYLLPFPSFP